MDAKNAFLNGILGKEVYVDDIVFRATSSNLTLSFFLRNED